MTLNDLKSNKKINNDPIERLNFLLNWFKKSIITKNNLTSVMFPQGFKHCLESNFDNINWWRPITTNQDK
jgi:hypothetical protein